jgi:hypothetical protein
MRWARMVATLGTHAAEIIDTLARKLTKQWDINNPNRHGASTSTIRSCWIYNRLTFEIIRASSICLRGYRRNDYSPMVYYDFMFWRPSECVILLFQFILLTSQIKQIHFIHSFIHSCLLDLGKMMGFIVHADASSSWPVPIALFKGDEDERGELYCNTALIFLQM